MFTHTLHRTGDAVCLHLTGELDVSDRARLRDAVIAASTAQPAVLRVDVAGVEFIDCAAVATLLGLRAAAAAAGTCLVLTHQHGVVRQVLQLLDLVDVFSEQLTGHAAAILTGCRDAQPTVL
ncbi:MAG TPA: STAS domain-containing protein [Actinoplanes sp.]|jgi:anti-anti-sigma factor